MRLINLYTYELKEHDDYNLPPYAILSHRWEEDEVLFADWIHVHYWRATVPSKRPNGWRKLLSFCGVARDEHDMVYGWADTVAIDKSSSAELTQAINSMYRYYQESSVCIAYLSDVLEDDPLSSGFLEQTTIAKVCANVLYGDREPTDYSIATRMSWAARRVTARPEDEAYCLLGIFDVNLPLIYGEGGRAFSAITHADYIVCPLTV
ncbi:hypothetical protein LTR17_008477 [Elasticomyces elasticus]|nr:hypothetical protein LTR17_008477 [Elasticomyces elasticus]